LKLKHDESLSDFAFNFNLRQYNKGDGVAVDKQLAAHFYRLSADQGMAWQKLLKNA